ncbi:MULTISPECIES: DMT family transporter [unclassified Fibrobacter]|uniref:DMT family transporter n=1 Tax=unclassified Fibrobacter TaxID=2634177 RepID=UPI0025BED235|nr:MULTISPECIES: DMT family transporter [unclassified Fibrobacter]
MSWLFLAFASAVFLGLYDLAKKKSVQDNAVRPVLCLCSAFYALFMLPLLPLGFCEPLSLHDHLLLMAKAVIVGLSWLFTYNAIAHMPLSISTTIRALAPLFTIMIAVGFMGERPFPLQWVGIAVCIFSYIGLSLAGRKEMGHFFSNGWVVSMLIGTILASCSGVYDKFILQRMNFEPMTVQVWFSIYMLGVQFITTAFTWYPTRKKTTPFQFRWSFIAVAALLIVADRCYFLAVSHEGALISIITVLRRSSVFISFLAGILIFRERKSKLKFVALLGVVLGLCLISLGKG